MNKNILIVIITVLILIAVGGVVLYMSLLNNETGATAERGRGLFPFFGQENITTENTDNNTTSVGNENLSEATNQNGASASQFRQLWREPVAGATLATNESGETVVHLIERTTGHVYAVEPNTNRVTRLSNTTIPRIQEVLWTSESTLVVRYLREDEEVIETFTAEVIQPDEQTQTATGTEEIIGELNGQFLPKDILHITGNATTLFYLQQNGLGVNGITSNFNGSDAQVVFSSPIRDWLPQYIDEDTVTLTTKAASGMQGSAFLLNTTNGSVTPLLTSVTGLTTNTKNASVLYAEQEGFAPLLFAYNTDRDVASPVPISTLVEKCGWGTAATLYCGAPKSLGLYTLPDDWYQGVARFDDELWKINTDTGVSELLIDPATFDTDAFDIVDIAVDSSDTYLIFRNRYDDGLWLYTLTVPAETEETAPEEN